MEQLDDAIEAEQIVIERSFPRRAVERGGEQRERARQQQHFALKLKRVCLFGRYMLERTSVHAAETQQFEKQHRLKKNIFIDESNIVINLQLKMKKKKKNTHLQNFF